MDRASQLWGDNSIHLQLPAILVLLDGLSREQHRVILEDYASFIDHRVGASRVADVICRVGRLNQPLRTPIGHFTVNGQYTPLQQRSSLGIEITGFDFTSHFFRGSSGPVRAELSFAEEEEFSKSEILENFLRILIAYLVLNQGGVLLHSVGVLYQDLVYLFCGRSNAGKTTLARKAASAGVHVLSDDINLVIPENGKYSAHKIPFTGEFGRRAENTSRSSLGSFPVGGLALLEKASELTAAPMTPAEGLAGLLTNCPFVNNDSEEISILMDLLTNFIDHMPIIRMGVGRNDAFESVIAEFLRSTGNAKN